MHIKRMLAVPAATALIALGLPAMGLNVSFAAEYNETGTTCWSGNGNTIVRGKGNVAMSFVMHGAALRDNPQSPFHKSSFKCVGAGTFVKGAFVGTLYCQAVVKNGDKLFGTCDGGNCKVTGGTGKLARVSGTWQAKILGPFPPPARGVFVNCSKSTYKIKVEE